MAQFPDYKGYEIEVASDGTFRASDRKDGSNIASATSLNALKEKIDQMSKAKFGFDVWIETDGRYRKGRITSARQREGRWNQQGNLNFRVTVKIGKATGWEDADPSVIFKDTDENRVVVEAINALRDQIAKVMDDVEEKEKTLVAFTQQELMGA